MTDSPSPGLYVTVPEVAAELGWQYRRTLRWLDRSGALIRRAGVCCTTRELLATTLPELAASFARRDDDPPVGALYLTIQQVSEILGWSTWRTLKWLQESGALVRRAGVNVTTVDRLILSFPEAAARIGALSANDREDHSEEVGSVAI